MLQSGTNYWLVSPAQIGYSWLGQYNIRNCSGRKESWVQREGSGNNCEEQDVWTLWLLISLTATHQERNRLTRNQSMWVSKLNTEDRDQLFSVFLLDLQKAYYKVLIGGYCYHCSHFLDEETEAQVVMSARLLNSSPPKKKSSTRQSLQSTVVISKNKNKQKKTLFSVLKIK